MVLGHPGPEGFCATMARVYCDEVHRYGQHASLRDLYGLHFDPCLRQQERPDGRPFSPAPELLEDLDLLACADVLTLIYPIWFGMPPAIIKGYIDRVLGSGFDAGGIKRGDVHPVLAGKRLMLLTSSAATRPWLEERGQWGALRQAFESYLQNIFGLRDAGHTHFDAVVPGAPERFTDECLAVVREKARMVAAEILQEKRARQSLTTRKGGCSGAFEGRITNRALLNAGH